MCRLEVALTDDACLQQEYPHAPQHDTFEHYGGPQHKGPSIGSIPDD